MSNELLLVLHSSSIGIATLIALHLGVEALVALICTFCLLANFFVIKQISLFDFNATAADAFTIGATLGFNFLQEYYGRAITKRTIVINFFILLLYVVMSQIHLLYQANACDVTQLHFKVLLENTPRIVIASFVVYCMTQTIDYYLYGFLKRRWSTRFLIVRNYISIMLSQLFDTVAFSFLGLYGIVDSIGQIIFVSYAIKIIAVFLSTPCIALSRFLAPKPRS